MLTHIKFSDVLKCYFIVLTLLVKMNQRPHVESHLKEKYVHALLV